MLNIVFNENDRPIIERLKKKLSNKFRPNSEYDIKLATRLAHYLFAIDDVESSKTLLESFLYFDEFEKEERHQHLWLENTDGLVLLSYIERLSGNDNRSRKLISLVNENNFFSVDDPEEYYQTLEELYEDHEFHLKEYLNETHKYRCEVLSQLFMRFLFFEEMQELTLSIDPQRQVVELKKIDGILIKLNELLKEELSLGK